MNFGNFEFYFYIFSAQNVLISAHYPPTLLQIIVKYCELLQIIDLCLAPLPGLGHRLLEHPDDLRAQLVDALLHPEDRDDSGVDGGEVVIVGNLGHVHVDLEAGLGTQRCPGDILDVKPEPMFLLKMNFDQLQQFSLLASSLV